MLYNHHTQSTVFRIDSRIVNAVSNLSCRASLVSSQQEVVSQSEIIDALSRDLAQAHARLSDMTGQTQSNTIEYNCILCLSLFLTKCLSVQDN